MKPWSRRRFVTIAAAAGGAGCGGCNTLTDTEQRTLAAICDQMIPPDQDPGGGWASAANYIARQLQGPFREHLETYRTGLAEADRRAGGSFCAASREEQFRILTEMEHDQATKMFVSLAATHSMQGFYGNPRHGGNRNYCSWRMLGVPASPVRGRDPYEFSRPGGKV
jgi:gluconate 2-dehydrogenase gamma chain